MTERFRIAVVEDEGHDLAALVVQAHVLAMLDHLALEVLPLLVTSPDTAASERSTYQEEVLRACELLPSLPSPPLPFEVTPKTAEIVRAITSFAPSLVLADSWLLQDNTAGLSVLEELRPGGPVLAKWLMTRQVDKVGGQLYRRQKYPLLTGRLDKAQMLQAATGEVSKGLAEAIRSSAADFELRRGRGLGALVGCHPCMLGLFREIRLAASHTLPVHIHGEAGVGKELVATEIHRLSGRPGALVVENCARLSPERADADLFGYFSGERSGDSEVSLGLIRTADGGTLFLDEIGELPLSVQAKLLRVVEDGVVHALGESQGTRVDVRFCSATNKDLERGTKSGSFREDLYHRLCKVKIRVPSLRERASDIPFLIHHFALKWSEQQGRPLEVPESVVATLQDHEWRGNVRQLESDLYCAAARLEPGESRLSLASFRLEARNRDDDRRSAAVELWVRMRSEPEEQSLAELARRHGKPVAIAVAELAIRELGDVRVASLYFGMSHTELRDWLRRERSGSTRS